MSKHAATYTELVQARRIDDGKWELRLKIVQDTEQDRAEVEVTLRLQRGPRESVGDVERRCSARGLAVLQSMIRDLGSPEP